MKYLSYMVLASLLCTSAVQAQFLKKLKQKVEEKVENRVTEKVSDKAASEADKSLENLWSSNNGKMPLGIGSANLSEVPETYQFSWKYDMKLETRDGSTNLSYLFEENSAYLGTLINQKDSEIIMVFDPSINLSSMYMNNAGTKMLMASKIKVDVEEAGELSEYEEMKITEIGSKEILGYQCKGYRMENDEYIVTTYLTEETNLNFANMFQSKANPKIPKTVDAKWFEKYSNGLMMEMEVIDKNKEKNNMKMYCTSLSKQNMQLRKSDYQGI